MILRMSLRLRHLSLLRNPGEPASRRCRRLPKPPSSKTMRLRLLRASRRRLSVEGLSRLVRRLTGDRGRRHALTFPVASFAARNTDLWQHLAAGRVIRAGGFYPPTRPLHLYGRGDLGQSFLARGSDLVQRFSAHGRHGSNESGSDASSVFADGGEAILIVLLAWAMMRIRRRIRVWGSPRSFGDIMSS